MKKMSIVLLFFMIQIIFCQSVFAYDDEAWFPDTFMTYYDTEKGMVVGTEIYDVDAKEKAFIKEDYVMISMKEIINIGTRKKENIIMLKEEGDTRPMIQISENKSDEVIFQKDNNRKTATIFWRGNTIVFFEGKRNVWINGETRYLYTEPFITEEDVYICAKDAPTLFCIASGGYQENGLGACWFYQGGEKGENIDIRAYDTINEKYQLLVPESTLLKFSEVKIGGQEEFTREQYSCYKKENEIMTEISFFQRYSGAFPYFEMNWDDTEKTAHIKIWNIMGKEIAIKAGSDIIVINSEKIKIPMAAELKNDRLHIPLSVWFSILEIPEENIEYNPSKTEVTFLVESIRYLQ